MQETERQICETAMLLLLLSHVSRVRLCATPERAAHQAPVPGILQARMLEWVAIYFFSAWKWRVKVKSLSHVQLLVTPWTVAYQAPPSGISQARVLEWGAIAFSGDSNDSELFRQSVPVQNLDQCL